LNSLPNEETDLHVLAYSCHKYNIEMPSELGYIRYIKISTATILKHYSKEETLKRIETWKLLNL